MNSINEHKWTYILHFISMYFNVLYINYDQTRSKKKHTFMCFLFKETHLLWRANGVSFIPSLLFVTEHWLTAGEPGRQNAPPKLTTCVNSMHKSPAWVHILLASSPRQTHLNISDEKSGKTKDRKELAFVVVTHHFKQATIHCNQRKVAAFDLQQHCPKRKHSQMYGFVWNNLNSIS